MLEYDKHLLKDCGIDVRIAASVVITHPGLVRIGDHVSIDPFTYATTALEIGSYVHIGPHSSIIGGPGAVCTIENFCSLAAGVRLVCGSDDFLGSGLTNPTVPAAYHGRLDVRPMNIRKYAILGTNVVVLPGTTVGEGAAVGACSLVTKDLEPWWLYVGVPARARRERSKEAILECEARLKRDMADLLHDAQPVAHPGRDSINTSEALWTRLAELPHAAATLRRNGRTDPPHP